MAGRFRTTHVRPVNAVLVYSLNFKTNKNAAWALNAASLPLFFLFGAFFLGYFLLIRPDIWAVFLSTLDNNVLFLIVLIAIFVAMIVLHELIHGVFFWLFTRSRPVFGLRGWYAFAAAPGWFLPRGQYLVTGLAPLVLGMVLMAFLPVLAAATALLMTVFNAASSVGDLWVAFRLLRQRQPVIVEDLGDGVNFYSLNDLQTEVKP
jgi:hypothetical protein